MSQGCGSDPDLSARSTILLGAFARADRKRELSPLVADLMTNFEQSGELLSGGRQQRSQDVRTLAANPQVLIDEPTKVARPTSCRHPKPKQGGRLAIVLVEQEIRSTRRADRVFIILKEGRG